MLFPVSTTALEQFLFLLNVLCDYLSWNIQASFYQTYRAEREVLPGAIIFHVLKIINLRNVESVTAHRSSQ